MNDRSPFERQVADRIAEEPHSIPLPRSFVHELTAQAGRNGQRPRWLALIKEPPMRISSSLAVGSPTARVAAIAIATLLLAVSLVAAGVAGAQLLAANGQIIVAQDGSGTTTTISDAVAMAQDGDEILVRPGTYAESVTITEDITLRGEDRDRVVIEFGQEGSPTYTFWAAGDAEVGSFGILIQDSDAEISHLTLRGPDTDDETGSVVAVGGAPFVHHITVEGDHKLYVDGGSSATVSNADISEAWVFLVDSPATFEDSTALAIETYTDTYTEGLGSAMISRNRAFGITVERPAVVQDNILIAPDEPLWPDKSFGHGIDVSSEESWVVRDNTITGFVDDAAIEVTGEAVGEIVGNTVSDGQIGLSLGSADHVVQENTIVGGVTGILIGSDASPSLIGNTIEGATDYGLHVGAGSHPTLSGNTICGNGQNLELADGAEPAIDDTNQICEDSPNE